MFISCNEQPWNVRPCGDCYRGSYTRCSGRCDSAHRIAKYTVQRYFGASMGRYAKSFAKGEFSLNVKSYTPAISCGEVMTRPNAAQLRTENTTMDLDGIRKAIFPPLVEKF